ncbi:serine/threonine protein kinase [Streptacidiphilus jiangxiensis]|uniref:serine/threonine protein kinase n=1 Tax=Streptacidiphilus jiangxiensis TaxID=235985 RepID=UPI001378A926|nr:serine/threonine-protein kinase [Streptacidiphilus jiangxiensis]
MEFAGLRLEDPRELGGFRPLARLGEGGMGQVFLALSPGEQWAAVKVIRRDFAGDPEFRGRFAAEVRAAQRVRGAHLASLLAADLDGEEPWLATTYVAGPSLLELVTAHGPLPAEQVMLLAWGIAHALTDIHAADIVHRDLKPANVILDETGPKVIDFGIVKSLTQSVTHRSSSTRIGTPLYMSPEQAMGRPVGAPSDIFALGSTLHRLATGREAFAADNEWAVAHRIVADHPDLTGLTPRLRDLIAACLDKDPDHRPTPEWVRTWCETSLGDTLGPGAWMAIEGSRTAIRSRTQALRTLTVLTSAGGPETHPRTIPDIAPNKPTGAKPPTPPGDSADPATAGKPTTGPIGAPVPSLEPVIVTKSQKDVKNTPHTHLIGLTVGLVAGVVFAGFGLLLRLIPDATPTAAWAPASLGISFFLIIYALGLRNDHGPDVVTVDSQGLTFQQQPNRKKDERSSHAVAWADISVIKVTGGEQRAGHGGPVRDRSGRLVAAGPKSELHVRYLDHVLPGERLGSDLGSGWHRIYGPSTRFPWAVPACELRDGLARFAGDRYEHPDQTA